MSQTACGQWRRSCATSFASVEVPPHSTKSEEEQPVRGNQFYRGTACALVQSRKAEKAALFGHLSCEWRRLAGGRPGASSRHRRGSHPCQLVKACSRSRQNRPLGDCKVGLFYAPVRRACRAARLGTPTCSPAC